MSDKEPTSEPPKLSAEEEARRASLPEEARRALEEADLRKAKEAAKKPLPTELGGRDGPEPVRFGDWEKKGIAIDF
ncbi:MAG: DUF1674 domain-containing protein [Dinoroseobacter sp.]|nr:DUF1674 domain-containing protein [Dinoroseobacter sp.]